MKTFLEFNDRYLTPGREKMLQMVDIQGKKEQQNPETYLKGTARRDRAVAVLGKAIRPDALNKELADKARRRFKNI
jgi:hypothetical protein